MFICVCVVLDRCILLTFYVLRSNLVGWDVNVLQRNTLGQICNFDNTRRFIMRVYRLVSLGKKRKCVNGRKFVDLLCCVI